MASDAGPVKVLYAAPRLIRIRQSLEEAGYRLITVGAPDIAALTAPDQRPDISLVDLDEMEDIGGTSPLGSIDAMRIPVVFVTRQVTPQRQDMCLRIGAMALLPEDANPAALAASLRLWVDRDREMKALRASELRLQDALLDARCVSHAVGMMAERHNVPVATAFQLLRSQARAARKRIEEFAKEVTPTAAIR